METFRFVRTRLIDNRDDHRAIRWTGGPQPHITHSRYLRAVTPGPIAVRLQVIAHELRIAEPTICANDGRVEL